MSLKEYQRKRDFARTPEPAAKAAKSSKKSAEARGRAFVVQKHDASRLHYDFRLELDGVLKSWAVPKGPSLDPQDKRLAVHVEDHPMDYGGFEGVIPEGQYGGGTVMLWDRGWWEPQPGEPIAYDKGKIKFILHGEKLRGGFTLVRMTGERSDGGKNWLLIKERDAEARPAVEFDVLERAESVLSGRSMEQIAAERDAVWQSRPADNASSRGRRRVLPDTSKRRTTKAFVSTTEVARLPGARRAEQPDDFSPQLAVLADCPPEGDEWLHEIKLDGYRFLALINRGKARLITRNHHDWTEKFPRVAAALERLPVDQAIIDGELVAIDDEGRTDFQRLQNVLREGGRDALIFSAFDLPYCQGFDLTATPLLERKRLLQAALADVARPLVYTDHIVGHGQDVLAHAARVGVEGIISKRADSPYRSRRSSDWLKIKIKQRQEFVIVGYTDPSGSRTGFGALVIGYHVTAGGELRYCGRVGTGFDEKLLTSLTQRLKSLEQDDPPVTNPPRGAEARGLHWVKPVLVAEVSFTEWTRDEQLRHPVFHGLREDKPAREIVREVPRHVACDAPQGDEEDAGDSESAHTSESKRKRPARTGKSTASKATRNSEASNASSEAKRSPRKSAGVVSAPVEKGARIAGVTLTNPDRVLYPEINFTKRDLARFYEQIADWVLPHVVNRALTLVRCPTGHTGERFYQKHLNVSLPDAVRGVDIQEGDGKPEKYLAIDDLAGLISLVQVSALELHPWGSRLDHLEQPDRLVFDLDPGPDVPFKDVASAAGLLRDFLKELGLESFLRTSGGKGLHVVVPLRPRAEWEDAKAFSGRVAEAMSTAMPKRFLAHAAKKDREGRIFVDYLRNARGATSIASYSTRARPGAPVATPIAWDELDADLRPDSYTVLNLPRRLAALKTDPWERFLTTKQSLTARVLKSAGL